MDDLDRMVNELAARQYSLIGHRQVRLLGASEPWLRHRRESGRWDPFGTGVSRLAGAPPDPRAQLLAATLRPTAEAWISHQAAAALHALPGFGWPPIDITIRRGTRAGCGDARVHRSRFVPDHHVTIRDQIPVTTLARTVFDLAGAVHSRRLERALDSAMVRGMALRDAWIVLLDLAEHGRNGTVPMRDLLMARRDESVTLESELEAAFLRLVRDHGLPIPETQVDLGDRRGWIGRVDFYFRPSRFVAEVDGKLWHTSVSDRRRDAERDARLADIGIEVRRYSWADVTRRAAATVSDVRARLARAA